MNKSILIVEDDADIAQSLADVLEADGFRVLIAANGQQGIELLHGTDYPNLILLDMMMPVMDGWQFRHEQQKLDGAAAIPVIVLTADGYARQKAADICAQGHLEKPVDIQSLISEVERVCGPPCE